MKRKIILGLLAVILLLFFITSSWAVDYKSYLRQRFEEHPWQESDKIPATPQTINSYPSEIKFIFILNAQPILIFIDKTTIKISSKVDDSAKKFDKGD